MGADFFKNFAKYFFVFFVYYSLGRLGLFLVTINQNISPVWFASGWAVGTLLYFNKKYWPAIFLGAVLVNLSTNISIFAVLLIAIGNTLEAFAAIFILKKIESLLKPYTLYKDWLLNIYTAIFSSMVSASIGSIAIQIFAKSPARSFLQNWYTWWAGDLIGILLLTPAMLVIAKEYEKRKNNIFSFSSIELVKKLIVFCACAVLAYGIYYNRFGNYFIMAAFPFVLYSGYFAGTLSIYGSLIIFSIVSIQATSQNIGIFAWNDSTYNFLTLQIYLCALAITAHASSIIKQKIRVHFFWIPNIGWLVISALLAFVYNLNIHRDNKKFDRMIESSNHSIMDTLSSYKNVLQIGAAFLQTGTNKDFVFSNWRNFVDSLNLKNEYMGLNGIGLILKISNSEINSYESAQKIRNKNFKIHTVFPDKEKIDSSVKTGNSYHYIITTIEPMEDNTSALGLDISSEINRKTAAESALLNRGIAITKNIELVQDAKKRPGFLMLYPIFQREQFNDKKNVQNEKFFGWIYTPVIYEKFLNDTFLTNNNEIDFWIYESEGSDNDKLLYSSESKKASSNEVQDVLKYVGVAEIDEILFIGNTRYKKQKINFINHEYTVLYKTNSNFISSQIFLIALIVFLGAILTLAVSAIYIQMESLYSEAKNLVEEKKLDLKFEEERWFSLMEAARVIIYQTNNNGENVFINAYWTQLTGYTAEETKGISWHKMIFEEDREEVLSKWGDSLTHDCCFEMEYRIVCKDKSIIWLSSIASPHTNNKTNKVEFFGIAIDITDRKKQTLEVEEKRMASVEAGRLASIGEMAGNIAHEINNPLTIISALTSQLRKIRVNGEEKEQIEKIAAKINLTVERVVKIIKGIRTISRNSEKDPLELVSLHTILDDVLEISKQKFYLESILLKLEINFEEKIQARAVQIGQVIMNLLNNAFDAIVDKEERWVKISTLNQDGKLIIRVTDSGKGIPKDVADQMMNPFFTTKGVGKGTGLGLSLSKKIINEHGGKLSLDSSSPNTCFVIELPSANSLGVQKAA